VADHQGAEKVNFFTDQNRLRLIVALHRRSRRRRKWHERLRARQLDFLRSAGVPVELLGGNPDKTKLN